LGPGAGERGGRIVASGPPDAVDLGDSLTLRYLRGLQRIEDGRGRAVGERGWLRLCGARGHNLRIDQVRFPLGNLVGISGVSGSGKSSLVHETLYPLLAAQLQGGERRPLAYQSFEGHEHLERVVGVDQRPMGRSRRSNAATYTGLLAPIRRLYAELPLARMRAYTPSHFSFNASQGACGVCNGSGGQARLQGEYSSGECGSCGGLRYRSEVLDVCFRDRNIADVLAMSVDEARAFFDAVPDVSRRLEMLVDVGLGYLRLGQEATSFSGGEAQRIKLAAELGRPRQGDTLYVLDEPTTGLHLEDVRLLQRLLQRLVDEGNTVVVVEHHIEFLAAVDWLIDLGPEGGAAGGQIVAAGTPRAVAAIEGSHTGTYLQSHFEELDG
ncbi:MAG: excinuclease ABC subunit UvrA, partial [Candidatus Latescibacterota bacterium]